MSTKSFRLLPLEGLRGLASLIVVIWHSFLGFYPESSGIFEKFSPEVSFSGSPLFVFMNGTGSVVFFFVLSGFVLPRSGFLENDKSLIARSAVRRYPRLMLPVLLAVLFSWLLFHFDLYFYIDASKISGSPWLEKFAYAYSKPFTVSFPSAFSQGLWKTFFSGESFYDSSLWTMRYEYIGSLVVFGSALALMELTNRRLYERFFFLGCITLLCNNLSHWMFPFIFGLTLCYISCLYPSMGYIKYHSLRIALIVLGLFLLGFNQPRGVYTSLKDIDFVYLNSLGGVFLILSTLSLNLEGKTRRLCYLLGEISFPLYLLHVPVLCSIGSYIFVQFSNIGSFSIILAMISTLLISVLLSIPLIYINRWWVNFVKFIFR